MSVRLLRYPALLDSRTDTYCLWITAPGFIADLHLFVQADTVHTQISLLVLVMEC